MAILNSRDFSNNSIIPDDWKTKIGQLSQEGSTKEWKSVNDDIEISFKPKEDCNWIVDYKNEIAEFIESSENIKKIQQSVWLQKNLGLPGVFVLNDKILRIGIFACYEDSKYEEEILNNSNISWKATKLKFVAKKVPSTLEIINPIPPEPRSMEMVTSFTVPSDATDNTAGQEKYFNIPGINNIVNQEAGEGYDNPFDGFVFGTTYLTSDDRVMLTDYFRITNETIDNNDNPNGDIELGTLELTSNFAKIITKLNYTPNKYYLTDNDHIELRLTNLEILPSTIRDVNFSCAHGFWKLSTTTIPVPSQKHTIVNNTDDESLVTYDLSYPEKCNQKTGGTDLLNPIYEYTLVDEVDGIKLTTDYLTTSSSTLVSKKAYEWNSKFIDNFQDIISLALWNNTTETPVRPDILRYTENINSVNYGVSIGNEYFVKPDHYYNERYYIGPYKWSVNIKDYPYDEYPDLYENKDIDFYFSVDPFSLYWYKTQWQVETSISQDYYITRNTGYSGFSIMMNEYNNVEGITLKNPEIKYTISSEDLLNSYEDGLNLNNRWLDLDLDDLFELDIPVIVGQFRVQCSIEDYSGNTVYTIASPGTTLQSTNSIDISMNKIMSNHIENISGNIDFRTVNSSNEKPSYFSYNLDDDSHLHIWAPTFDENLALNGAYVTIDFIYTGSADYPGHPNNDLVFYPKITLEITPSSKFEPFIEEI